MPFGAEGALVPQAAALETADTTAESAVFTQSGTQSMNLGLPSSYLNQPSVPGQGADHTAWAFAAAAVLEEAARKSLGSPASFSANHMRFALSSDSANTYGFPRAYTAAGNRSQVAAYLMRSVMGGPVYTSLDPYSPGIAASGEAQPARPLADTQRLVPEVRAAGVIYIPDLPQNAQSAARELYLRRIKEHIYTYGAVAVSLYYDDAFLNEGVYRFTGVNAADHSVAITGWDDNYAYSADGKSVRGAFRAVDSAFDGGRGGTYYISFDTAMYSAYTVSGLSLGRFDKTYEYDAFGLSSLTGFSSESAFFAAVYTASSASEVLEAVTFFAPGEETRFEIFLARVGAEGADAAMKAAVSGGPVRLEGGDAYGVSALPGYLTVPLETPWAVGKQGEKFAVVIKAETPHGNTPVPLMGASLDAAASAGRCYVSASGEEWVDTYTNSRASVCLKAHTRAEADIPLAGITLQGSGEEYLNGVRYPILRTAPGQISMLGPVLDPSSANDIVSTQWFFGDENAENFFRVGSYNAQDQSSPVPTATQTPNPDRDELDAATGRFTARILGRSSIRCEVTKRDGTRLDATMLVDVSDIEITEIIIDTLSVTMKTNQKAKLNAAFTPSDATADIVWRVARDRDYTPYALEFDEKHPYVDGAPIASVSESGEITPVLPGVCYIYAESGGVRSGLCEVTIEEIPLQNVTFAAKTVTLSLGTSYTAAARAVPSDATYRTFSYTSSNGAVASVDAQTGILNALAEGSAVITAVTRDGRSAVCAVTVTSRPTRVIKVGKGYTPAVVNAVQGLEIKWAFAGADVSTPLKSEIFGAELSASGKAKLTAKAVGGELLRAWQERDFGTDEFGNPVKETVWEQSYIINAVEGNPRLEIREQNTPVKTVTLCVDPTDPARADTVTLAAGLKEGSAATLLGFEWSARKGGIVALSADESDPLRARVSLRALAPGTVKVTAMNYNGNKKVTVNVRVLLYPEQVTMAGAREMTVSAGSKFSLRAKVNAGKNNKQILYLIRDAGGNNPAHSESAPIVTVDAKGRLAAQRPGRVKIIACGAPFDESAARTEKTVQVNVPLKKLALSESLIKLQTGGVTGIHLGYLPADTTQRRVSVVSQDKSVARLRCVGEYFLIYAAEPGRTKITVTSLDDPKKKLTLTVSVSK
ncbi:MAG: lectin like domain-containing protein [Oscillospiraceae bacterium]|nr:lectin like domain-containing protein [Oscillospiraceae bacterium]